MPDSKETKDSLKHLAGGIGLGLVCFGLTHIAKLDNSVDFIVNVIELGSFFYSGATIVRYLGLVIGDLQDRHDEEKMRKSFNKKK